MPFIFEIYSDFARSIVTSNDFIRASNSLQLDETVAIYASQILSTPSYLGLVNNKHPMVPASTYSAAYRLVLHGLATESLHEVLVKMKLNKESDGIITPKR